nr:deoxynucleoside kinase [Ureibacillus chungkukjangi]
MTNLDVKGGLLVTVPFITVEGPIGVGKTSLSKAISDAYEYHLLKEIVDENPFLGKFYEDIDEWSFQTEMFFLCNRYKQLSDIKKHIIETGSPVVADYHIFKNLIFAKRTLKPSEYEKYEAIYKILTADMPRPNMVVYLHASLDTLMDRIALRGREFEKMITRDYIEQLAADYHEFIQHFEVMHPDIPVIQLNGDQIDFVKNPEDLEQVLKLVEEKLRQRSSQPE